MPDLVLREYTAAHLPAVEQVLREFFAQKRMEAADLSPHLLYSLCSLEDFVFRGGKFLRSLLVIAGYRLAGGTSDDVYSVAAAVEMFHKYIISIDDMADRDEQRYGGPTLWKFYEEKYAVLGWADAAHHGRTAAEVDCALLASYVTELVRAANLPAADLLAVLGVINEMMYTHTIAGWQIHYHQNHQPLAEASEAEYLRGLELVSADYSVVAPLQVGMVLAGQSVDGGVGKILTEYGKLVGRAFQMQDDILGMFGKSAETGKPVGNDLREGKKTALLQRTYRSTKLTAEDRTFLEEVCGREISADELARVQKLMTESGVLEEVRAENAKLVEKAKNVLEKLPEKSTEKEFLSAVATFMVERKK